jgi:hypothetical protein
MTGTRAPRISDDDALSLDGMRLVTAAEGGSFLAKVIDDEREVISAYQKSVAETLSVAWGMQ